MADDDGGDVHIRVAEPGEQHREARSPAERHEPKRAMRGCALHLWHAGDSRP